MRILRKSPHVMIILQLYGHRLKPIFCVCLCQGSGESDMVVVNPHEMKPYISVCLDLFGFICILLSKEV